MSAPPRRRWAELTSADFAEPEAGSWVAVLPVAATEQHGPHLPTGVDTMIGDGLLDAAIAAMPDALPAIVLPTLAVGKSDEHRNFPGTLSLSAETLLRTLVEIGESVARAGLAKLVIMSSHGGNSEVMGLAARELRLRRNMLVVATSWARLGQPDGLFRDDERRHGIHAGDIETSLMLHLAPGLVHMERAEDFVPVSRSMEDRFQVLRATGATGFAWLTEDLNPQGACGDATLASAAKGRASAQHAVDRFIALVGDIARFDPPWNAPKGGQLSR
jgi:creatinine amidohydrolase